MKTACIIAVYNTPPLHLMEAVNSVYYQNGVSPLIILVDDGSTDVGTINAIYSIAQSGVATVITHDKNMGAPSAFNSGHKLIEEIPNSINFMIGPIDYVFLMGSQDISHPDRFRLQLDYIKKHPETDVLGTGLSAFYDDEKLFRKTAYTLSNPEFPEPRTKPPHHKFFLVNHGTVCYRQSAVMAVGGYDPKFLRAQDVNLWERMWNNKAVFRNIPQILYAHRRERK